MELDKDHPVKKLFAIDNESNTSKCLIDSSCSRHVKPMKGHHSGNLMRHVKRYHVKEYDEIVELLKNVLGRKRKRTDEDNNQVRKLSVNYSVSNVLDACVEMVTINGRPFNFLADSGFQKLISPITNALNISINPEKVRELIPVKAAEIRQKITDELKGKLLCLKIDSAKRLDRSLLGQSCVNSFRSNVYSFILFTD
jgi:hypothetical protein